MYNLYIPLPQYPACARYKNSIADIGHECLFWLTTIVGCKKRQSVAPPAPYLSYNVCCSFAAQVPHVLRWMLEGLWRVRTVVSFGPRSGLSKIRRYMYRIE